MTLTTDQPKIQQAEQKYPDLSIVIDLGASGIKVVYVLPKDLEEPEPLNYHFFYLKSGITSVNKGGVEFLMSEVNEEGGWIEYKKSCYGYGSWGYDYLVDGQFVEEAKIKYAFLRILGVLNSIIDKENIQDNPSINLKILFPVKELKGAISELLPLFKKKIRYQSASGRHLLTPGQITVEFSPECAGLFYFTKNYFEIEASKEFSWKDDKIATIMLGHRNVSLLVWQKGKLIQFEQTDLGFYQFLKMLQRYLPFDCKVERLLDYIVQAGWENNTEPLTSLCRQHSQGKTVGLERKIEEVKAAIEKSKKEFVTNKLIRFINEKLSVQNAKYVMVSGGSSDYFKPALETQINREGIKKMLFELWQHQDLNSYRYLDSAGMFRKMLKQDYGILNQGKIIFA